ncbi:MAG: hypothetical protein A2Y12_04410 [Planctomycetes bacterium GWF2_42_9]|nr:MAG: hypothetical protein A2Y12_04410 [Planctomycetes bacterium GWF2_42_9]
MNLNIQHIAGVLKNCWKETVAHKFANGTNLLIMFHGGRLIGFSSAKNDENFLWTNPALKTAVDAKAFYEQQQWRNSGGDRTWLAPELELFFPNYPDLNVYVQPQQLDPGNFLIDTTDDSISVRNKLAVNLYKSKQVVNLAMTKKFTSADNPVPQIDIEYAGFTSTTSLEILDSNKYNCANIGLWHLTQLPCGGKMIVPTYQEANPVTIFGELFKKDLSISDNLCLYNVSNEGSCKFSLQAIEITGRAGYVYDNEGSQTLVVRNFFVNPCGLYIDVPFNEPQRTGFAFQVCKINNPQWGNFVELEYHTPAIGSAAGQFECTDVSQTWAFRGEPEKIQKIIKLLLTSSKI